MAPSSPGHNAGAILPNFTDGYTGPAPDIGAHESGMPPIASGSVRIPLASLHERVRARGDHALADVPGLLERLDIPQLRELWPTGQVSVKP